MSAFSSPPGFQKNPPPSLSATELQGRKLPSKLTTSLLLSSKERIRKMFDKVELSTSAYDTAWVAMLPCPNSPELACFPQCVKWVADNQLSDGSWGLPHRHPSFLKDSLSSTLACVLVLKQWGLAEQLVDNGLQFIESNSSAIFDPKQRTPIGFDIIFPTMLESAKSLNLNVSLRSSDFNALSDRRASELQSSYNSNLEGRRAYLAYISEGMGSLQDWEMAIKFKRKNGSLFDSPSATAAAFRHLHDPDCLSYLDSVLQKFGSSVPTIYPLHIYTRLCMVDTLERLGVDRHFREEIKAVLDETYRCWLQGEEEVFLDPATCAMAFRILRTNGYDVSSDVFVQGIEDCFFNSIGGYISDAGAALELYRASQITYPDEQPLEKLNLWATQFLWQDFSSGMTYMNTPDETMTAEVRDVLRFLNHADLQRLTSRRCIKHFSVDSTRILKSSYRCPNLGNEDLLDVAIEDFNLCQSVHREELDQLERWVIDMKLDKLMFARQKLNQSYFTAAATMFEPELSDARIAWVKFSVLATIVDDFYDVEGSEEELVNLVQLIEKWHINWKTNFCSERVEIMFSAIHNTVCEIADKALPKQGRDVTGHIVELWLDLVKSMLKEAQWSWTKSAPTLDEYMANAYVSFALGPIVLPALYLVGPKLSEAAIGSPECNDLFKYMSIAGRLLNDWRTVERESLQGKLNAVSLLMIQDGGGGMTEDEAVEKIKAEIGSCQLQLRELVLREKGNPIPRTCRNLFWHMLQVLHLFYAKDDGYTGNVLLDAADAVIKSPISVNELKWNSVRGN